MLPSMVQAPRSPARTFPSLRVLEDRLEAEGAFAEAQAEYLSPDPEVVAELDALLAEKKIGVVAHFYMDPQLQGVLASCSWPHIGISDSLVMADRAVSFAQAGCRSIIVLGVDFMSENARAMLDKAGLAEVPVYRVAAEPIGCSLAAAADTMTYSAWLTTKAARTPKSLHVVYINTSLRTKARSHAIVPTITCTSSNVVQTVLSAFAEIPDVTVFFGPDTYMGANLARLFSAMGELGDDEIAKVHPAHDRRTLAAVRERFAYFESGNCIVHHMFGEDVVRRVRAEESDSFVTAHLEVPGEMFELAIEARASDRGVVGSTSDILSFISRKVKDTAAAGGRRVLRFVLGTEAGMITSIVRDVQKTLRASAGSGIAVEIVFPVASEAIAQTDDPELAIVPGASGGEGCSTAGGCATCPYMKMNSLDALGELVRRIDVVDDDALAGFHPAAYVERVEGRTVADVGSEPILHMRHFQKTGRLSPALIDDVTTRHARRAAEGTARQR
jgi:quinolinate synthase